jgi:16S rRNA U1498 N3-methylase RsmE
MYGKMQIKMVVQDATELGVNGVTVLLKNAAGATLQNNDNKQSNNRRSRLLSIQQI